MRILLVEDDSDIREVITEYLIAMGHAVDALSNGREALEQLGSTRMPYDIALVDWQLPGITGRDVIQGITQGSPATAVLITTGHASNRIMQQVSRSPQVDMIQKPFSLRELHRRILSLTQGASLTGLGPAPI